MKQIAIVMSTVVLIAASVACSTPANPSATKAGLTAAASAASQAASEADSAGRVVTDALSGVSMTAPAPLTPTDGQASRYAEQPLTLVVKNAATTGATPTYTFQVAGDAAFGSLVFNQEGIAQGAGANTSVALPNSPARRGTLWRARATSGTTVGLFSAARSFNVGPEVVLQAPVLASPGSGAAVSGTISMVTNNVQRSGPVTAITYRFDLSNTAAFSPALASAVGSGTVGNHVVVADDDAGAGPTHRRVQAFDNASGVSSPVSGVLAFLEPAVRPAPGDDRQLAAGLRQLGGDGEDHECPVLRRFVRGGLRSPDLAGPLARRALRRRGASSTRWTGGIPINKAGHWNCSAVVQFWFQCHPGASGVPAVMNFEWFYDFARWEPMTGYQPEEGETVGLFVCAGDCRNNDAGDPRSVREGTLERGVRAVVELRQRLLHLRERPRTK